MKLMPSSLRGRLILGMTIFTIVALAVTLVVMDRVFDRFVTGQINQRLDNKLVSLQSQIRIAPDGTIRIDGDANGPPFDEPRHMSFWHIEGPRNAIESRWLKLGAFTPPTPADIAAAPPPPHPPHDPAGARDMSERPRTLRSSGPDGVAMHMRVVVQRFGTTPVIILAAAPLKAIADPIREAMTTLASAILTLGLASILASFSLVNLSLQPLTRLRREVAAVRTGRTTALPADQPIEIRPLVEELNDLLAQNAANLGRARKHVANLAHGLKTPLATLSLGVARLDGDARASLLPLVDTIERRVRHHLARARAAALDGPVRMQTQFRPHLFDIVDALQKIYAEKRLVFALDAPIDLAVACEPQDLDEILGNLLENAFKYTRRRVTCKAWVDAARVVIEIADDGPGLRDDEIARMLRPGQRLDEQVPGFGFGLPIARELTELYAGELVLTSQVKGLLVTLTLPAVL